MADAGKWVLGSVAFASLLAFEVLTPAFFLGSREANATQDELGHVGEHGEADLLCPKFGAPGLRRYQLTAQQILWQASNEDTFPVWTWNGTIPGPTLCARVGDEVEVTITNKLPTIISFHAHGLHFDSGSDGTFHTRTYAPPGGTFTYRFTVGEDSVGTWAYHDSVAEMDEGVPVPGVSPAESGEGIERGLYGAIVVYGEDEESVDHEVVVAMGDVGPEVSGRGVLEVFNGRAGTLTPRIHAAEGERVRFRLINAGPNDPHDFFVTGHTLVNAHNETAAVGHSLDEARKSSVVLGALTFGDFVMTAGAPGRYEYLCLFGDHADAGMKGEFIVHPKEA